MKFIIFFFTLLVFLLSGREIYGQTTDKEKAKKHFKRGVEFFNEGKYEDALIDFEASYNYRPHWKIKFNMAFCHYYLKHYMTAAEMFTSFLEEGKENIPQDQLKHTKEILAEVKSNLAILRVTGEMEGAVIRVDGKVKKGILSGQDILLEPGEHSIYVAMGEDVIIDEEITFKPGAIKEIGAKQVIPGEIEEEEEEEEEEEIEIKEEVEEEEVEEEIEEEAEDEVPPPREKNKLKIGAWGTLAAGAALLVGGAVTGGLAGREKALMKDAEDEYMDAYNDPGVPQEDLDVIKAKRDDHFEKSRNLFYAMYATLAAGGALTATSIILFVMAPRKKSEVQPVSRPTILITPWSATLQIEF